MCYGRNLGIGPAGRAGRGGRHHRRAVHRRAGHPAHDADLPHRRHREPRRGGVQARGQERGRGEVPQPPDRREPRRRPGGHQPQRRDRGGRRAGPGARALSGRVRRQDQGQGRAEGQGAHGPGRVGSVHQPDPHRVHRPGASTRTSSRGDRRVREEFDEVTGLARKVIIEDAEGKLQPGIIIRGDRRSRAPSERHRYPLPVGANLTVADGAEVFAADIIAKIPRETTKTKDITGGLPRVAELFEARKPKEQAVITEIDGRVEMGGFVKGMRKIVIRADNAETKEYLIPRGKHISVHEGDRVQGGRGPDGRLAEPARLPGRPRRSRAAAVPGQRGAGGLSPAGRDDQRQAHRDHRASDAAARADRGGRRHRLRGRRAGRQVRVPGGERAGAGPGQAPGHRQARAPRHHQGVAVAPTASSRRPPSRRRPGC